MKPLLFAAASNRYFEDYGNVLMNSATVHNMPCCIHNGGDLGDVEASNLRFLMLPDLLKEHKSVLVLDIDSIIMESFEIDPDYDLGIFLRPDRGQLRDKTLLAAFYITDAAMDFALNLRELCRGAKVWADEQKFVWELYEKYKNDYRIWTIDDTFLNWKCRPAKIWSGKGSVKYKSPDYRKEHNRYA